MTAPERVLLAGKSVLLEPLDLFHLKGLWQVARDPGLWTWTLVFPRSEMDLADYIREALRQAEQGRALPFAVIDRTGGMPIGSTRFGNIDPPNERLEVGWTWIARDRQGSGANAECKLLLLAHAFESLGCARVEFKTDARNARSRRALLGIGAREEGILRSHLRTWDGRLRDTVYYSILATEWPDVKARLERKCGYL